VEKRGGGSPQRATLVPTITVNAHVMKANQRLSASRVRGTNKVQVYMTFALILQPGVLKCISGLGILNRFSWVQIRNVLRREGTCPELISESNQLNGSVSDAYRCLVTYIVLRPFCKTVIKRGSQTTSSLDHSFHLALDRCAENDNELHTE
jgi:hypothetical protein